MTLEEMTLIIRELLEDRGDPDEIDAMITRIEEATGYPDVLELLEGRVYDLSPEEIAERIYGYSEKEA